MENGGFELGTLADWSPSSFVSATSAVVHSGKFSALIGEGTPFNGHSTLTQDVAVPSTGTTTLTFWGNYTCPGTNAAEQWARVWVLDSSGKRLAQVLRKCDNTKTWEESTLDLTPYGGKTVTLQVGRPR